MTTPIRNIRINADNYAWLKDQEGGAGKAIAQLTETARELEQSGLSLEDMQDFARIVLRAKLKRT